MKEYLNMLMKTSFNDLDRMNPPEDKYQYTSYKPFHYLTIEQRIRNVCDYIKYERITEDENINSQDYYSTQYSKWQIIKKKEPRIIDSELDRYINKLRENEAYFANQTLNETVNKIVFVVTNIFYQESAIMKAQRFAARYGFDDDVNFKLKSFQNGRCNFNEKHSVYIDHLSKQAKITFNDLEKQDINILINELKHVAEELDSNL